MMESPQLLRISDSPFEMRMRGDCDVNLALPQNIADLDNDYAAREFFLQLQLLHDGNIKQYGGEDKHDTTLKVFTVQLPSQELPLSTQCGQESPAEKVLEELSEARTMSTESSYSNTSTSMTDEESNLDEPADVISIEGLPSEKNHSCDIRFPPNEDSPAVEKCSESCLGIERENYTLRSEKSSDYSHVYASFNIPPPLYGNDWGDEPDMSDYFYPEILSVIEEVDVEDDVDSTVGEDNSWENEIEPGESESSLCNCDLYISEGGIRIVKSSSISSDRPDGRETNAYTDNDLFRPPHDGSMEVLKNMSPASTAEETESSEDADYDEYYKEENCYFFLDGCISLFTRYLMTKKQSCFINQ
ncbi:hypothetical protein ACHAXS_003718 [Conticribra weissflogii]